MGVDILRIGCKEVGGSYGLDFGFCVCFVFFVV